MSAKWNTSVIVTTYNSSDRLRLCLAAIEMQSVLPDEIVIADDGSTEEHVRVVEEIVERSSLKIVHAWQEDAGPRRSANRNNGVRHATGDYLLFVDGDAVLLPECVAVHLAESTPRHWLTGDGVWLTEDESSRATEEVIRSGRLDELWPGPDDPRCRNLRARARRFRMRAFMQWLWWSERQYRKLHARTIHFSVSRAALEKVNGFDEAFEGHGNEDADLGLRLQIAGFRGRTVADRARALHLYHEQAESGSSNADYHDRPRHGEFRCQRGLVSCGRPQHAGGCPDQRDSS